MKLPHPWVLTPVSAPRPGSLWSLHLLGESIPSPSLCPGSQLSRLRAGALSNLATQHRPRPQSSQHKACPNWPGGGTHIKGRPQPSPKSALVPWGSLRGTLGSSMEHSGC